MVLTSGSKLGTYEIIALLGAGGMGEVYRARDTKLGRDVAIKALTPQFARDPDRLARFEREAKLLASLSHPHIAGIFGLEDIDGHRYLILEFVEGETLAHRLERERPSIQESLQICRQIASALESAHENGIAHRDLKPGNVIITPAGDAKVLDFGLAKGGMASGVSSDPNISHSPTLTQQQFTGAGVILGTAAYMSPEQARGRAVDKRTDIWSFGCVLYECLTGQQAFAGDTVSDLIARILEREPDWDALPSRTPPRIRDLLKRCLDKDSRQRLRDIGDARIEIEDVIATRTSSPDATAAAQRRTRSKLRTALGALALVLITAAVTYFAVPRSGSPVATRPTRFEIPEMPGTFMDFDGAHSAISPDGRTVVYVANDSSGVTGLWIRNLESIVARKVPGSDNAGLPFWSPDGGYVAFFKGGQNLVKVAIAGGDPETITKVTNPRGGSWSKNGVILYAPLSEGTIYRVSAGGGDGVAVTTLDSTENAHRFPCFLPDGKRFLYSALPPREGRYRIYLGSLDGKLKQLVLDTPSSGVVYASPGYLLYDRDGVLVAHRFDEKKGRVIGEPISLGDQPIGTSFAGGAGVSAGTEGTLAYTTNLPLAAHLIWADREGAKTADVPVAAGKYINVRLSPDGRQAILERSPRATAADLWLADLERGVVTRFSYEAGQNTDARWSPDGTRVAYMAGANGSPQKIVVANVADGASRTYLEDDPAFKSSGGWTPDGRALMYARQASETRWDIWILPLDEGEKPRPFLVTPYWEERANISPDGRWITYRSNESGRFDVYVQSFPNGGHKYKVTTRGGDFPRWSPDGRHLYFAMAGVPFTVFAADVITGSDFRLGPARPFVRFPDTVFNIQIAPDGRVLQLLPAGRQPAQSVTIVQNWQSQVTRK